jgi:hypothetical protein
LESQCRVFKRDGSWCTATVNPPQTFCWWHNPANQEQRTRAASKGGKAKAGKEIKDLKAEVKALIGDVRDGNIERADATALAQLYRVLKDFIELERKREEVDDVRRESGNTSGAHRLAKS